MVSLVRRLGLCGDVGLIAGAVVGGLLALAAVAHPVDYRLGTDAIVLVVIFTAFLAWLTVVAVLVALARLRLVEVAIPALVTTGFTAIGTVGIALLLDALIFSWAIGPATGALVGFALCRFCRTAGDQA